MEASSRGIEDLSFQGISFLGDGYFSFKNPSNFNGGCELGRLMGLSTNLFRCAEYYL